jgi:hypothetical protein
MLLVCVVGSCPAHSRYATASRAGLRRRGSLARAAEWLRLTAVLGCLGASAAVVPLTRNYGAPASPT